ncbi:UNVERIFIED_CONTAM: hypothetical protein GTU68_006634 [Idotea baltica]|nr:hypothetical protein [Idotea baltica]
MTGVSGSGKSSLAFDTLYAEGQRRYVESLSTYARQFLGQLPKPNVDSISGLAPSISIQQKSTSRNPRSTVGTITEIFDYLRVLFARVGQGYCYVSGKPIKAQSTDSIIDSIAQQPEGTKYSILAPIVTNQKGEFKDLFADLLKRGYLRARVDGDVVSLNDDLKLRRHHKHNIEVVVDRCTVDAKQRGRIADSIEAALDLGKGVIRVVVADRNLDEADWPDHVFSLHLSCLDCGLSFDAPSPQQFSFNSPLGWCWSCEGLGTEFGANQALLVTSPESSLLDGAIGALPSPKTNAAFRRMLEAVSAEFDIPLDQPWYLLNANQQRTILYGDEDRWVNVPATKTDSPLRFRFLGLFPTIEKAARMSFAHRRSLMNMGGEKDCSICGGSRLQDVASHVQLKNTTMPQLCRMPLEKALQFLKSLKLNRAQKQIAGDLLTESVHRLTFLVDVGLNYLTLNRGMPTLSGGESQRIRLAGQVGRSLTGVLYVLDEPTIGLHPRDNGRLLAALQRLRDLGNTVLLVEHDREVIEAADQLYDFGPGAGRLGGTVVAQGSPKHVQTLGEQSLTAGYLSGERGIPVPMDRRMNANRHWLRLLGASQNNLQNVDLEIPLGAFTCITGVSGSGKSSLVMNTLARAVARKLNLVTDAPGLHKDLHGIEHLSKIVVVDQNPIGNTPASNPATYVGLFDHIRTLFTQMPDSRVRGFGPGRFSFNRSGGRCDDCEGMGQQKIEMHFLPDVWVECATCRGKRYNEETLSVKFNGYSIADVLEMPIEKALKVFENVAKIRTPLATLDAIGLGYLTLGQSAPTLSGGEAQRIKLAAELAKPNQGRSLYLLDEPTTGLHFDDIAKLLSVLNSLVEKGNTVVVIEHNLDVIKTADWIVDLGPEAGSGGGYIVAAGTPEDIAALASAGKKKQVSEFKSWTADMLAPVMKQSTAGQIETFDVATVSKKRSDDVGVAELGRAAKLPWETDGKRWHTKDCLSHDGKRCRWDGDALAWVIDTLSDDDRMAAPNWNNRSTVEVKAANGLGWLLHARTGHEWMLVFCFRVKKFTFDQKELAASLNLTPIDDIEEVQYYSQSGRVSVRNLKTPWQEISIKVWKKEEIDTPAFRKFLQTALETYSDLATKEKANPDDLTPWKQLGRKWHLMKKSLPKRPGWTFETLETLLPLVEKSLPDKPVDYGHRSKIVFGSPKKEDVYAELWTRRKDYIDVVLNVPQGTLTVGAVAKFGAEQEVVPRANRRDLVSIRFKTAADVTPEFGTWLADFLNEQ